MRNRLSSLMLWCCCLLLLGLAFPVGAQDGGDAPPFATNTPELVLVPRDAVGSYTDLTPLRDAILAATDEPGAPAIVYVEAPAPADPSGIGVDDLLKIGGMLLVGFALWVTHRNGITFAQLVPAPLVQEMVKSAATAGVEAARTYAASTPNKLDDELVRELAVRVAAFFSPPPATTADTFVGMHPESAPPTPDSPRG